MHARSASRSYPVGVGNAADICSARLVGASSGIQSGRSTSCCDQGPGGSSTRPGRANPCSDMPAVPLCSRVVDPFDPGDRWCVSRPGRSPRDGEPAASVEAASAVSVRGRVVVELWRGAPVRAAVPAREVARAVRGARAVVVRARLVPDAVPAVLLGAAPESSEAELSAVSPCAVSLCAVSLCADRSWSFSRRSMSARTALSYFASAAVARCRDVAATRRAVLRSPSNRSRSFTDALIVFLRAATRSRVACRSASWPLRSSALAWSCWSRESSAVTATWAAVLVACILPRRRSRVVDPSSSVSEPLEVRVSVMAMPFRWVPFGG